MLYAPAAFLHRLFPSVLCLALVASQICSFACADEIEFERIQLSDEFYSEGGTFGDYNHDGHGDVAVGPWIYWGPDFESTSTIYEGPAFPPIQYSKNFLMYSDDVNADGNLDILVLGFPGEESWWYENPGQTASTQTWKQHVILEHVSNESPLMADIDGDGVRDLVCIQGTGNPAEGGRYGFASHAQQSPDEVWKFTAVSPYQDRYKRFVHGLGVGDVNNDGHQDLLEMEGWWENPGKSLGEGEAWEFHQVSFSSTGGSQMYAVDLDGDGKNEVLTGLAAHGFGLVYYQALNEAATKFERVEIMTDDPATSPVGLAVSQLHAVDLGDINRDGIPDIVTGKRWWAHANSDPGNDQPATLLWFETQRSGERVRFIPHVVDNSSGVGTQITAGDVNGDGLLDIVSGNKRGAYLFLQKPTGLAKDKKLVPGLAAQDRFHQRPALGYKQVEGGRIPTVDERPVNLDFETGDSQDWEIRGPIADGAIVDNENDLDPAVIRLAGKHSVNTDLKGNRIIGEMISRPFTLCGSAATCLLGGTNNSETRVEIVSEESGLTLAQAVPDGSPGLVLRKLELPEEAVGKLARIRIIDHAANGHVRFDAFRLQD